MASRPSIADVKTFLSIPAATTTHDAFIATLIPAAEARLERLTGRTLASASNVTRRYSLNGAASIVIHDVPYFDGSRSIVLGGVTLSEGSNAWLLPDRRNPDLSTTLQVRTYNYGWDWWRAEPGWFDRNLDTYYGAGGEPNDLVVTGLAGHPDGMLTEDTRYAILVMAAYLFRERDAAAGSPEIALPDESSLDLSAYPPSVQDWVRTWRIRTGVTAI